MSRTYCKYLHSAKCRTASSDKLVCELLCGHHNYKSGRVFEWAIALFRVRVTGTAPVNSPSRLTINHLIFFSCFLGLQQHKSAITMNANGISCVAHISSALLMTQKNGLELAQQGNPYAIAALINSHLLPQGITAKAALEDGCLKVTLESDQVPDQQNIIPFIHKEIMCLEAESIKYRYGYKKLTACPISIIIFRCNK